MKLAKMAFLVTDENMGLCLYIHYQLGENIIYIVTLQPEVGWKVTDLMFNKLSFNK